MLLPCGPEISPGGTQMLPDKRGPHFLFGRRPFLAKKYEKSLQSISQSGAPMPFLASHCIRKHIPSTLRRPSLIPSHTQTCESLPFVYIDSLSSALSQHRPFRNPQPSQKTRQLCNICGPLRIVLYTSTPSPPHPPQPSHDTSSFQPFAATTQHRHYYTHRQTPTHTS